MGKLFALARSEGDILGGDDCRLGERASPVDGEGSRNIFGGVVGG